MSFVKAVDKFNKMKWLSDVCLNTLDIFTKEIIIFI
jgi:hypothetical protein